MTVSLRTQEQLPDLDSTLADRRAYTAGFRVWLRARWGEALDLFELLVSECSDIGGEVNEQYRPRAVESQDHRFEALMRLHGKASLTASEILTLLETGHAMGAMARWRTLHDVNVMSAFLAENDDSLSYRYLRHEDYQTLKIRRSYDKYAGCLGYEPMTTEADGDPDELRESLVDEFGSSFLERNGWAAPAFGGRPPKDTDFELKAGLDHMRPYVYLASDGVHATPKGLMSTLQHLGEDPIIMAGPSNAGLADPGHGAAISFMQVTTTLASYILRELSKDDEILDQAGILLSIHVLMELSNLIGEAFLVAAKRLEADEESRREPDE